MIYYGLMIGLAFIFALIEMVRPEQQDIKRIMLLASCSIAVIIAGFREDVGADWHVYLCYHSSAGYETFLNFITINDPAYMAISWLAAKAGFGIWAVNLPCAFFLVCGIYRLSSHVQYRNLFFLSAAPILIIVVGMGFSRQSAAIGMYCLALHFLLSDRRQSSAVFAIMALPFHKSAAFGIAPIFLTYGKRFWSRIGIGILALPFIIIFVMIEGYQVAQRGYIDIQYNAAGAFIRVLQVFICGIGFFILLWRREVRSARPTLTVLAAMSVLSIPALMLSPSTTLVDRLALYLLPFQCYVLASVPISFRRGVNRSTVVITVILINVAIFSVWMSSAVNSGSWVNYRNYLWSGSSLAFQTTAYCR